jgi:hypothetical protein
LAPVFLGAEDHPPRDRRPKCLTGSAITLVRSARPNPRGRHARVADPSGVECQRDGSDQGQRMEAGDGVLTSDRSPAPSRDANRSPAVPQRWSQRIVMFQTGSEPGLTAIMNTMRVPPPDATSGKIPQRAEPLASSGWTCCRTRDRCPNGGRLLCRLSRGERCPVPALPGCAIALPFSDLAIECVVRRGHLSCHLSALSRM